MCDSSTKEWVAIAKRDPGLARLACTEFPDGAAFHVQQAAEKLVKALWAEAGMHAPKSHDIGKLAAELAEDEPMRGEIEQLSRFTKYVALFRYPQDMPTEPIPEPSTVEAWTDEIGGLITRLERRLNETPNPGGGDTHA